mmetsp:Transcript_12278/g.20535  ORF Transcript_12278/g.20535 Transcript_12278/m.20535 type:complete len:257 (-) Transcript_12278:287-1057(-)
MIVAVLQGHCNGAAQPFIVFGAPLDGWFPISRGFSRTLIQIDNLNVKFDGFVDGVWIFRRWSVMFLVNRCLCMLQRMSFSHGLVLFWGVYSVLFHYCCRNSTAATIVSRARSVLLCVPLAVVAPQLDFLGRSSCFFFFFFLLSCKLLFLGLMLSQFHWYLIYFLLYFFILLTFLLLLFNLFFVFFNTFFLLDLLRRSFYRLFNRFHRWFCLAWLRIGCGCGLGVWFRLRFRFRLGVRKRRSYICRAAFQCIRCLAR